VRFYALWNPFVPYTGQVLGVVGAGLILGPAMGSASMTLYLALGAVGLPVFADYSGGIGVLMGATAGYLYSYPIAAGITRLAVPPLPRPTRRGDAGPLRPGHPGRLPVAVRPRRGPAGRLGRDATEGLGRTVLASSALVAAVGGLLWKWSKEESTASLARMATGLVGVLVIYTLGWIVLPLVTGMAWSGALAKGVIQFVPVNLAKVFVAAGATGALLPPATG
jgi:biotin transport system substrate-specific component